MKRIFQGLRKTRERFLRPLRDALSSGELDEEAIEEAEAILYSADLGVDATERIIDSIRTRGGSDHMQAVADELRSIIDEIPAPPVPDQGHLEGRSQ